MTKLNCSWSPCHNPTTANWHSKFDIQSISMWNVDCIRNVNMQYRWLERGQQIPAACSSITAATLWTDSCNFDIQMRLKLSGAFVIFPCATHKFLRYTFLVILRRFNLPLRQVLLFGRWPEWVPFFYPHFRVETSAEPEFIAPNFLRFSIFPWQRPAQFS